MSVGSGVGDEIIGCVSIGCARCLFGKEHVSPEGNELFLADISDSASLALSNFTAESGEHLDGAQ